MDIHISQNDGIPVYQQIMGQIKNLVASGRLQTDEELPAIRKLAEQLLINPNTVARAYRELESSGWVYKRRGSGTFVSSISSPLSRFEQSKIVEQRIASLLTEAYQIGFSLEEVIDLIRLQDAERQISAAKRAT